MPTELIPMGMSVTLKQNVVYALPAVECVLYTDGAAPTLLLSNSFAFTNNTPVTVTAGAASLGGAAFIKSTAGDALVTLKRD